MTNSSVPILKFAQVTKLYGDALSLPALDRLDLEIARGSRIAIMGPSGSGKSTLLNLACGLDEASSGHVLFDGEDLAKLDDDARTRLRREKIGMIFQTFNLLPTLTALENAALPLRLAGTSARQAAEKASAMLAKVGLSAKLNNRPAEMSGGERQRTAIARALIFDPPVLLADEPTGNLDSHTGEEILHLMDDLHSEFNTTIVLVTHNELAAERCERILTLHDGAIASDISRYPEAV
jgi:putative ABC transport system ATP-binding protein